MFTLKFESEYLTETKINIYSINGKIIHSEKLENHTIQFDLQHLKKGIYFATVKQKNRVSTKKIIIS